MNSHIKSQPLISISIRMQSRNVLPRPQQKRTLESSRMDNQSFEDLFSVERRASLPDVLDLTKPCPPPYVIRPTPINANRPSSVPTKEREKQKVTIKEVIPQEKAPQIMAPKIQVFFSHTQENTALLIDLEDNELLKKLEEDYKGMSIKSQQEILKRKADLRHALTEAEKEFQKSIDKYSKKWKQMLAQEAQNRIITHEEKQARTQYFSQLVQNKHLEMKKTVNKSLERYIQKLGKRKNRTLPAEASKILKEWFLNHYQHPYPSEEEKKELQEKTGLSITQINNWFINKRVRIWRPLVGGPSDSKKH